jgi:nitric oxide reductase NorE protein
MVSPKSKTSPPDGRWNMVVENGALFWHLVDVLWIGLFSLLYLMR